MCSVAVSAGGRALAAGRGEAKEELTDGRPRQLLGAQGSR